MINTDVDKDDLTPMRKYKLLYGVHVRDGVRLTAGDELNLTDEKAARMGDRVRLIGDSNSASGERTGTSSDSNDGDTGQTNVNPWVSVLDQSAPGVIAVIQELQEKSDLAALIETEENGANRKGVLIAANKRMGELEEEGGQ